MSQENVRPLTAAPGGARLATRPSVPMGMLSAKRTLALLALLLALCGGAPAPAGEAAIVRRDVRAGPSAGRLIGVGDQQSRMFANPFWQRLHTRVARYIAPYDAAVRRGSLARATAWIRAAEAQHQQILVAFYHSDYAPTRLPSIRNYLRAVRRFVKRFPNVRAYEAWDEANRGTVRPRFASPSPLSAARYYQALRRACPGCAVVGLDVLDHDNPSATLRYIAAFKREIHRLRTVMPSTWGLHNYSDVNRLQDWRTRKLTRALGGRVWLTETGGIVKFGRAFRNVRGSGLARASRVVRFTLRLASRQPRIKHVYFYNWSGVTSAARFDAGLTDRRGDPRPAYIVLCRYLLHSSRSC
jgi:hypothetical protein